MCGTWDYLSCNVNMKKGLGTRLQPHFQIAGFLCPSCLAVSAVEWHSSIAYEYVCAVTSFHLLSPSLQLSAPLQAGQWGEDLSTQNHQLEKKIE